MRALRFKEWQSDLVLEEVDRPEPGPGQVLIKVAGCGACHSDLHLLEFPPGLVPFELPFTFGHETAGWVEEMGPGATGFEKGEPVIVYGPWGCGHCRQCRLGSENYCENVAEVGLGGGGLGHDGGMAEYMLVPSTRLLISLGDMDPTDAGPLGDAGLTTYHAVKRAEHLLVPGSTAVVVGCGGLGHMAIQILKATTPARVVAVDQSEDKLKLAAEVGADDTLLSGSGSDTAASVKEMTRGLGAEVVFDIVGTDETIAMSVQSARVLGEVVVIGIGMGTFGFNFFTIPYECALVTTYWGSLPELMEVIALAKDGKIQTHVTRFTLDNAMEAYKKMKAGEIQGRAVITPN